eukprot:155875-Chlamydomonas_euryale.AAC.1
MEQARRPHSSPPPTRSPPCPHLRTSQVLNRARPAGKPARADLVAEAKARFPKGWVGDFGHLDGEARFAAERAFRSYNEDGGAYHGGGTGGPADGYRPLSSSAGAAGAAYAPMQDFSLADGVGGSELHSGGMGGGGVGTWGVGGEFSGGSGSAWRLAEGAPAAVTAPGSGLLSMSADAGYASHVSRSAETAGTGFSPAGTGVSPSGTGFAPAGAGLAPAGTGLAPAGAGLSPAGTHSNDGGGLSGGALH